MSQSGTQKNKYNQIRIDTMKKEYILSTPDSIENDFMYITSPVAKSYKKFDFSEGCALSGRNDEIDNFDYISIVTKEKYSTGVTLSTECSFDSYGAPLIVLSDDIAPDNNGRLSYGLLFEVVAWEKGCNVWHIVPFPERKERPIKPTLIAKSEFAIEPKSVVKLSVTVKNKKLAIIINGVELEVENADIPESFHIGITGCEGVNRFYSISIED